MEDHLTTINDFPEDIMREIIYHLPSTKDAIRTALISKVWLHQWRDTPALIFDSRMHLKNPNFIKNVEIATDSHNGGPLTKFHLHYHAGLPADPRVAQKVAFAIVSDVKDLVFLPYNEIEPIDLTEVVTVSETLLKAEFGNFLITAESVVYWPNLTSLKLNCFDGVEFGSIARAVAGSPSLQSLKLIGCPAFDEGTLQSNSLKILEFEDFEDRGMDDSILIKCPVLESLILSQHDNHMPGLPIETFEGICDASPLLSYISISNFPYESVTISSTSLRKLELRGNGDVAEIVINCPSLKELFLFDLSFDRLNITWPICDDMATMVNQGDEVAGEVAAQIIGLDADQTNVDIVGTRFIQKVLVFF